MSINTVRFSNSSYPSHMQDAIGKLFVGLLIFSIPMLKFIEFNVVGRLFAPEIILFCIFMFMLVTNQIYLSDRMARLTILLCLCWLCGQIVTDIIHDVKFIDYARGWAKISFTMINFITLYELLNGRKRLIGIFAAGIVAGGILEFYLNPGVYTHDYPWKFGVGPSFTWLFILVATVCARKSYLLGIVMISFISSLNLFLGYRSLSGICFLTGVYLTVQWIVASKRMKGFELSIKLILTFAAILSLASFGFIKSYEYLVRKDVLGVSARQLYEEQSQGMLGILIGGRSEILISWRAILDSPVIGHGSWAKNEEYAEALINIRRFLGYYSGEADETGLIPTHSHIFGAWVEAGILGAVFWAWTLFLPIRSLASLFRNKDPMTPLFAFISFLLIWDIFFSPYSTDRRFLTPYYMVALMTMLSEPSKEHKCAAKRME